MSPADSIKTHSTGGPGRNHVPGIEVTGKVPGTYTIDWTVKAGSCPCEETLPVVADRVLQEMFDLNEAFESGDTLDWDPFDDPGTDSDSEDADCGGTLPLGGNRFRVGLKLRGPDRPDSFSCNRLGQDMAGILFNAPEDLGVLVKVLDGCQSNGHYWVFSRGERDHQGFVVTVTDTVGGSSRTYEGVLGRAAPVIVDPWAFHTCP
jgi:hypothetical protein